MATVDRHALPRQWLDTRARFERDFRNSGIENWIDLAVSDFVRRAPDFPEPDWPGLAEYILTDHAIRWGRA